MERPSSSYDNRSNYSPNNYTHENSNYFSQSIYNSPSPIQRYNNNISQNVIPLKDINMENIFSNVFAYPKRFPKLNNLASAENEFWDSFCWYCHYELDDSSTSSQPDKDKYQILFCENCQRAFHDNCVKRCKKLSFKFCISLNGTEGKPLFKCPECQEEGMQVDSNSANKFKPCKEKLNKLLYYAFIRIKKHFLSNKGKIDLQYFPVDERIVARPINFNNIETKIHTRSYDSTYAFLLDLKYFYHNALIYSKVMKQDCDQILKIFKKIEIICKEELNEIEVCYECYGNAHELSLKWFEIVCKHLHPLVWAKVKGFPYWPGKVMRIRNSLPPNSTTNTNNGKNWSEGILLDIRFFGTHEKAWIPVKLCYTLSRMPPSTNSESFNVIRNKKDYDIGQEELNRHIKNIEKLFDVPFPYTMQNFNFPIKFKENELRIVDKEDSLSFFLKKLNELKQDKLKSTKPKLQIAIPKIPQSVSQSKSLESKDKSKTLKKCSNVEILKIQDSNENNSHPKKEMKKFTDEEKKTLDICAANNSHHNIIKDASLKIIINKCSNEEKSKIQDTNGGNINPVNVVIGCSTTNEEKSKNQGISNKGNNNHHLKNEMKKLTDEAKKIQDTDANNSHNIIKGSSNNEKSKIQDINENINPKYVIGCCNEEESKVQDIAKNNIHLKNVMKKGSIQDKLKKNQGINENTSLKTVMKKCFNQEKPKIQANNENVNLKNVVHAIVKNVMDGSSSEKKSENQNINVNKGCSDGEKSKAQNVEIINPKNLSKGCSTPNVKKLKIQIDHSNVIGCSNEEKPKTQNNSKIIRNSMKPCSEVEKSKIQQINENTNLKNVNKGCSTNQEKSKSQDINEIINSKNLMKGCSEMKKSNVQCNNPTTVNKEVSNKEISKTPNINDEIIIPSNLMKVDKSENKINKNINLKNVNKECSNDEGISNQNTNESDSHPKNVIKDSNGDKSKIQDINENTNPKTVMKECSLDKEKLTNDDQVEGVVIEDESSDITLIVCESLDKNLEIIKIVEDNVSEMSSEPLDLIQADSHRPSQQILHIKEEFNETTTFEKKRKLNTSEEKICTESKKMHLNQESISHFDLIELSQINSTTVVEEPSQPNTTNNISKDEILKAIEEKVENTVKTYIDNLSALPAHCKSQPIPSVSSPKFGSSQPPPVTTTKSFKPNEKQLAFNALQQFSATACAYVEDLKKEHNYRILNERMEKEMIVTKYRKKIEMLEKSIEETKRKHWCIKCLEEASSYCCVGIWYCTKECQLSDWPNHKKCCVENKRKSITTDNPIFNLQNLAPNFCSSNNNNNMTFYTNPNNYVAYSYADMNRFSILPPASMTMRMSDNQNQYHHNSLNSSLNNNIVQNIRMSNQISPNINNPNFFNSPHI